jgi:tRNA-dihydrouridine synthase
MGRSFGHLAAVRVVKNFERDYTRFVLESQRSGVSESLEINQCSQMVPWVGVAPMEGVGDIGFRIWLWLCSGPSHFTTPFLRITKDFPAHKIPPAFYPEALWNQYGSGSVPYYCVPQLMGPPMGSLAEVAKVLSTTAPLVELNCGCPAPTVVGNGAGSALLQSPEVFLRSVEHLAHAIGLEKVAIKMRLGWENDQEIFSLLSQMTSLPIGRLTLHARTRNCRYKGLSRWQYLQEARKLIHPRTRLVGSGDVLSFKTYEGNKDFWRVCDGIIIGRGAIRNPWIFKELKDSIPISLENPETLLHCLFTFGLLNSYFQENPLTKDNPFATLVPPTAKIRVTLRDWQEIWQSLRGEGKALNLDTHEFPRGTFAKIKMIWNYLRSSLEDEYFKAPLLQCSSWPNFVLDWKKHFAKHQGKVNVSHHSKRDWIFAGEKKNE